MRIAIFAESFLPKWDGVTNTTCYLLEHLAVRGHTSLMFAPQGAPPCYANTPIIGLPSFALPFYPELRLVPPLFNVEQELADFEPDVVHLINPVSLGLVGMRHAQNLELPIVASYQTDIPGYAAQYGFGMLEDPIWAFFRWVHNQADLTLCPSYYTLSGLEAHGFERLQVWSRGVDTTRFSPRHRSNAWRLQLSGARPEAPLMLYVGRLAPEKRVEWLRPVLDALPGVRLAIVGDGPLRDELEEEFAGTATIFLGYLQGHDLARAYASADFFVFPSPNETFGNAILEAMASGLPVIVPRSGGPVDFVTDNENGLLFDPETPSELTGLVQWLISNPEYARRFGASARAYAETQSWEEILDGLLDQYASVVRRPVTGRQDLALPGSTELERQSPDSHDIPLHA